MAKVFKNVEQVQEARAQNEDIIFNKAAALMALKSTPKHTRVSSNGSLGDLSKDILECFKAAGSELSVGQVIAMYAAAKGQEATKELKKKISDKVWGLSDKNKNNKNPALKQAADKGCYTLA